LENLLDEALEEIRYNLNNNAEVRAVQGQLLLRKRSDGQILRTLPDYVRVWMLDKETWKEIFGRYGKRGAYEASGNKILLEKDCWCRKTIFHESLHSVSIFSDPCNREEYRRPLLFVEGMTEFLTGLLLFRRYRHCYENWRLMRFPRWCSLSYPRETKTFLAFCGCTSAQSLLDLYFGTHSNELPAAWRGFTRAIRQDSGKKFKDVFREGERIGFFMAFKNECERQFGKKFRKLQKFLDYDQAF